MEPHLFTDGLDWDKAGHALVSIFRGERPKSMFTFCERPPEPSMQLWKIDEIGIKMGRNTTFLDLEGVEQIVALRRHHPAKRISVVCRIGMRLQSEICERLILFWPSDELLFNCFRPFVIADHHINALLLQRR